jgi:hypothetical protein
MSVYRVKIRWTGFTGSPGYTLLHFDAPTGATLAGAQDVYDQAVTFMSAIGSALHSTVKLTAENTVEVVNQTNAQLEDFLTVTASGTTGGTASGGYSSSTGACITWDTGEVKNGRRVRGRTFIVPLAGTSYDADGTLTASALTDIQGAADGLAGGGFSFGVLSRPSVKGAEDGSFHTVTSGRVTDKTAMLRSRRD